MARRDRYDDDIDDSVWLSRLGSLLAGIFWAIVLIGGGLIALNEYLPSTEIPTVAIGAAEGQTGEETPTADSAAETKVDEPPAAETGDGDGAPTEAAETATDTATVEAATPETTEAIEPTTGDAVETTETTEPTAEATETAEPTTGDAAERAEATEPTVDEAAAEATEAAGPVSNNTAAPEATEPAATEAAAPETAEETGDTAAIETPAPPVVPVPEISLRGPAIDVNSQPFNGPPDAGLISVVLYGAVTDWLVNEALGDTFLPLTVAIRPGKPDEIRLAESAGARGFEVLAVLPLSTGRAGSTGLTAGDSAQTLEVSAAEALAALKMSIGAVAPDGAGMLDDPEAMAALLRPVAAHSFVWVEPRASSRSAAARLAVESELIFVQAKVFVEPGADVADVKGGLDQAVENARRLGSAIVFVEAGPEALRTVVTWALQLGSGEVVLAPLSAVVRKRIKG